MCARSLTHDSQELRQPTSQSPTGLQRQMLQELYNDSCGAEHRCTPDRAPFVLSCSPPTPSSRSSANYIILLQLSGRSKHLFECFSLARSSTLDEPYSIRVSKIENRVQSRPQANCGGVGSYDLRFCACLPTENLAGWGGARV